LATAAGGALAAAMIGMGTAHADTPYVDTFAPNDPYDVLFGAEGTQGTENATLDAELLASNPSGYATFNIATDAFEGNAGDHGLENLIFAIDPSAFYEQTSTGVGHHRR
jgi:hypothetical protein